MHMLWVRACIDFRVRDELDVIGLNVSNTGRIDRKHPLRLKAMSGFEHFYHFQWKHSYF